MRHIKLQFNNKVPMPLELEEISLQQRFEEVIASENKLEIQEFLNHQNISDVANLIYFCSWLCKYKITYADIIQQFALTLMNVKLL